VAPVVLRDSGPRSFSTLNLAHMFDKFSNPLIYKTFGITERYWSYNFNRISLYGLGDCKHLGRNELRSPPDKESGLDAP
jgi:hypothetical protein